MDSGREGGTIRRIGGMGNLPNTEGLTKRQR